MEESSRARLDLFINNTHKIKGKFIWHNTLIKRLAALLYTAENKEIDCDAIGAGYELIKENTTLFSSFRGNCAISIAALISLTDDRQKRLSDTLKVYNVMKEAGFRGSDFLTMAAYQIAANTDEEKILDVANRAKAFYDGMKKQHFILTGQNDYIFAAMLGLSDISIETGLTGMERLYASLKPEFLSGNAVQALTQVLVLGGDNPDMVKRVLTLRDAFRARGIRLDREYTLPSLGVLSLLPADEESLARNTASSYDFLRGQQGFGIWSVTKQELLIFSSALVALDYTDETKSGILSAAVSTNITNIIIAQQTAIAAAAASSAAAASAASD